MGEVPLHALSVRPAINMPHSAGLRGYLTDKKTHLPKTLP